MAAQDDKVLELWQGRKAAAYELRQLYEERWIENWQWYRNTRSTRRIRGQQWRSNATLADGFRLVESLTPQHVMSIFRNPRWFSVEAPSVPGQTYQEIVRALLLQGWRKADGYKKTIEGIKLGNILGHFITKCYWETEIGEREVQDIDYRFAADGELMDAKFIRKTVPAIKHNGPQIEFPDLFNVWQDPTGKGHWFIERIPTGLDELKQQNKQFGGALYRNLDKISANVAMRDAFQFAKSQQGSTEMGPLSEIVDGVPEQLAPDHVELWQCWGYVPKSIRDYSRQENPTQWRLIIIADGSTVIRDVPAPTPNHLPPYTNIQAIPIPGQIYGDCPLSYTTDLMELRSAIENSRRDSVLLNMYPSLLIDARAGVRGNELLHTPGGALQIDPMGLMDARLADLVMPLPRQPILQEAYLESDLKKAQMDEIAGSSESMQNQSYGARTTASEINKIRAESGQRVAMTTMWMDESFKRPVLEQMFRLYQTRLTTPEVVQLVGNPEVRGEVDFTDLEYDVDIYVDSGLFGSMDAQQAQTIVQMYQVMLSSPATDVYVDPAKFVRALSYRLGLSGGDDFIRSDDEVAQIQAQRQQQQLLMAAMGEQAAQ